MTIIPYTPLTRTLHADMLYRVLHRQWCACTHTVEPLHSSTITVAWSAYFCIQSKGAESQVTHEMKTSRSQVRLNASSVPFHIVVPPCHFSLRITSEDEEGGECIEACSWMNKLCSYDNTGARRSGFHVLMHTTP